MHRFQLRALVLASWLALRVAGCSSLSPGAPAFEGPAALKASAGESVAMTVSAEGVQIHECRARMDGAGHEWAFVAPEADLFDSRGRRIGRHGAGPSWQSDDGSRVVGTVKARADAWSPGARDGAIPWLLLSATSTGPEGALSRVSSIQRVNTVGGVAPAMPCTPALAGRSVRVDYTADYVFFSRR